MFWLLVNSFFIATLYPSSVWQLLWYLVCQNWGIFSTSYIKRYTKIMLYVITKAHKQYFFGHLSFRIAILHHTGVIHTKSVIYMAWFSFMWHFAQMKRDISFSKTPSKSSKKYFFSNFFYLFLLIFVCSFKKFEFQVLGVI